MATSVKIDERTKDRLDHLQATVKLETGRKVTQKTLLDRIVAREFDSRAALIDSFRQEWDGLSPAETERWLSGAGDWGETHCRNSDEAPIAKKLGLEDDP